MDNFQLTILTIYFIYIAWHLNHLRIKNALRMNSEPLTHQPLFIAAITIPLFSFIAFGLIIWVNYSFQLNEDGFNTFLNISKLPLALLSLSIPFGVVVNNIHRTIQTDKQIKEAEKKNRIDGFYNHRKNTIDVFQNVPFMSLKVADQTQEKLEFENSYKIYGLFFPNSSIFSDIHIPSRLLLEESEKKFLKINKLLTDFPNPSPIGQLRKHNIIEKHLEGIHKIYHLSALKEKRRVEYSWHYKDYLISIITKFPSHSELQQAMHVYFSCYVEIHNAVGLPVRDEFIKKIKEFNDFIINKNNIPSVWTRVPSGYYVISAPKVKVGPGSLGRNDPHLVHIPS
ncbi:MULTISPECIES: hypothetical protein [unclassified Kosakonia]|uniref:hypothetical protein n=1 Tax=unclassified Kosakonia TaxID=2632876 RepID=UPI0031B6DF7A